MSKFCSNCGAPIDDNIKICGNCGKENPNYKNPAVGVKMPQVNLSPETMAMVKKYGPFAIIGVIAIIVIVVAISIISASTGYKGAVSKYINAIKKEDGKAAVSVLSNTYIDWYLDKEGAEKDDYIDAVSENFGDIMESYEYYVGENVRLNHKIIKVTKKSKNYVKNWKRDIKDNSRYENMKISNVTDIMEVRVKVRYKGSDDDDDTTYNLLLVKEKGGWKIWPTSAPGAPSSYY